MPERHWKPYLWLIAFVSLIVPQRFRAVWRQEWVAELRHRESLLQQWQRLNWRTRFNLLKRSLGSFWDALWLQPHRLEEDIFQDLRYGTRALLKEPGFTLVAITILALGTGANTAIFSVVNAVLLRPLPYPDPDRLVLLWNNFQRLNMQKLGTSPAEYLDYRDQNQAFDAVAAFSNADFTLVNDGESTRIVGARATANLFPLLATRPMLGRTFLPEEDIAGAGRVVVLSHDLWQRQFGASPSVIGRAIILNSNTYTVIGVMPPHFQFPPQGVQFADRSELWIPTAFSSEDLRGRDSYSLRMIARLKPSVTLSQSQANMDAIVRRLDQQYQYHRGPKGADPGWRVTVVPLMEEVVGDTSTVLSVLLGAVTLVLLIACANVANLLLARATGRQKEIAVRTALGASRLRILRQLLTESVLLSALGGIVGFSLALWGVRLLSSFGPVDLPRSGEISFDIDVLSYTLIISLLTGLLFGLAPALQASRLDPNESLKEGTRNATLSFNRQRTLSILVVCEVALAMVLLVSAGLLIKSFIRLMSVDPGIDPKNVVTFEVSLSPPDFPEANNWASFFHQLLERLEALPGVRSASMVTSLPLNGPAPEAPFSIEGRPYDPTSKPPVVRFQMAGPNYFRTMGIPVMRGRDLSERETSESSRVVMINEALARAFFPGEDPIGKQMKLGAPQAPNPWLVVAGVVGDVKSGGLEAEAKPEMYLPYIQRPRSSMTFVLRSSSDPASVVAAARNEVRRLDRNQPIFHITTMGQVVSASVAQKRFSMLLLAALAVIALTLAAVGLFGVIAYSVRRRTHEIGIRMALGAQKSDVLKMVVGQGMTLALIGIGVGVVGSFVVTRLMASLLYGVSATDPLTSIVVATTSAGVAMLACYIPARRAAVVDPMAALRSE